MIIRCADALVAWLIKCDVIKETDKELYYYAVYSILLSVSPMLLAIIFGLSTGTLEKSILIILPFMSVRKFSGGYHAKKESSCLISSSLLILLCIALASYIRYGWGIVIITAMSSVSLAFFSPIDNENRVLCFMEKSHYKKVTFMLMLFWGSIIWLLYLCHLYESGMCVSIGIILSATLQLPCIIKQLVKKPNKTKKCRLM